MNPCAAFVPPRLVHLLLSPDLVLFLSKRYQNNLHFQLPCRPSHKYTLLPPARRTSYLRQHIILVSVVAECSFFGLPVWSHCKYFQYSITAPKSLQSLPGEKQNSHLRFSCRAFFRQILLLPDLHPPLAPEELTFQTPFFPIKHPPPNPPGFILQKMEVISVYLSIPIVFFPSSFFN